MPVPSWVSAHNIRFDGTTQQAVDCGEVNGKKLLIVWDNLPMPDKINLEAVVAEYGNQIPLPGPTPAFQSITFFNTPTLSSPTQLEANRKYVLKLDLAGDDIELEFVGSDVPTFGDLVDLINDTGTVTAELTANRLKLSTVALGLRQHLVIRENNLVKALNSFKSLTVPRPGINTISDILSVVRSPNGEYFGHVIPTTLVGDKPVTQANTPKTPAYTYYGGTPALWRYTADDTPIAGEGGSGGSGPSDVEITGTNINFLG